MKEGEQLTSTGHPAARPVEVMAGEILPECFSESVKWPMFPRPPPLFPLPVLFGVRAGDLCFIKRLIHSKPLSGTCANEAADRGNRY